MNDKKDSNSHLMLTGEDALNDFYTAVGMSAPSNGEVTVLLNPGSGRIDGVLIARAGITETLNLPKSTKH